MKITNDTKSRGSLTPTALNRRRTAGFTLIEILLVTVIIGGIIAAIAIPSFNVIRRNNRIDNTATQLANYGNAVSQFEQNAAGSVYPLTVAASAADVTAAVDATTSPLLATATFANFNKSARFDQVLLGASLVKTLFSPPMGNQVFVPTGWTATTADMTWSSTTKRFSMSPDSATPPHDWTGSSRLICALSNGGSSAPSASAGANFLLPENNMQPMNTSMRIVSAVIVNANASDAYALAQKLNPTLLDATSAGSAQNRGRVVFGAASGGVVTAYVYLSSL